MSKLLVLRREEAVVADGHAAPTCRLAGRGRSRLMASSATPLWLVESTLEAGSALVWEREHGDEIIYVSSGSLEVAGDTVGAGAVLVLEAGVALRVESAEQTAIVHFGSTDPSPPSEGPYGAPDAGHRHHVIGPRGVSARHDPPKHTVYFATGACRTCRGTLMQSSRTVASSAQAHSHTQDELLHLLAGELRIGSLVARAGDTLAVPAHLRYRFDSGPDGYDLLNFRPDVSWYVPVRGSEPLLESGHGQGFSYTGDGTDYLSAVDYASGPLSSETTRSNL